MYIDALPLQCRFPIPNSHHPSTYLPNKLIADLITDMLMLMLIELEGGRNKGRLHFLFPAKRNGSTSELLDLDTIPDSKYSCRVKTKVCVCVCVCVTQIT